MSDRVVTFSIKLEDTQGRDNVDKLKQKSRDTGVSFSWLVLDALQKAKEAEDDNQGA